MRRISTTVIILLNSELFLAQNPDSLLKNNSFFPEILLNADTNLTFNGAKITSQVDELTQAELKIGGYISTYYAIYDDEAESKGLVQFPTLAARNNQFALNMGLITMEYKSKFLRGNIGFHYGDVAESTWPANFKLIQEANAGFRIHKKIWFDAGFFKTHVGLESFQPRENITSSMSIVNYHEPYYFSGAKLTFYATSKLSLQANVFNGYSDYSDFNKNKVFNFSAVYSLNQNTSLTYNFLTSDESPTSEKTNHQRVYNNFYLTYSKNKFTLGLEANYGTQKNSLKSDSTKTATMYSGLIVAKYQLVKKTAVYGRVENFSDPDQILSTNVNIGKYINGTTLGVEYKPQKTAALSAEWRILESDNLIFKQGNKTLNQRNEFILCLDLWF
ncbi:MAG: outer membrane beta-barrel protein [Bacteroidota bacterium]|nr:outer membrane beta-barrel protein [Bacteroidota bacterium]MDP3146889.1 outer membrane beta-barrel protein [Bacteroidota bacterium]